MTKSLFLLTLAFGLLTSAVNGQSDFKGRTITLTTSDKLSVTGDMYFSKSKASPLIILFHQAGYSRGEYREIAPKLNALGFNCLAIDQRSGNEVNGVVNETHKNAVDKGLKTEYINAIPDMDAAIDFATKQLKYDNIIIWGSSYSAEMVFYLGSKYSKEVSGILAFSPGAYFDIEGLKIEDFAAKVDCPVFITSAKSEEEQWKDIYDAIEYNKYFFLPEDDGLHGSKALWSDYDGNEAYWKAVKDFLAILK